MSDLVSSSAYLGLFLSVAFFLLPKSINRRLGREVFPPLLTATMLCIAVLVVFRIDFDIYFQSARFLDVLLTPTTICLAIPLYRQFELLRKNAAAVLAGCLAGVVAHMAACSAMLLLFDMDRGDFISLLPKSITAAIGKSLSAELGGDPAITMALIMITGLFGSVVAPAVMKLARVSEPLAQGLGIGCASHASGTSKAVEMGDVQGAASGLAIVVAGLLTVLVAPLTVAIFG